MSNPKFENALVNHIDVLQKYHDLSDEEVTESLAAILERRRGDT